MAVKTSRIEYHIFLYRPCKDRHLPTDRCQEYERHFQCYKHCLNIIYVARRSNNGWVDSSIRLKNGFDKQIDGKINEDHLLTGGTKNKKIWILL